MLDGANQLSYVEDDALNITVFWILPPLHNLILTRLTIIDPSLQYLIYRDLKLVLVILNDVPSVLARYASSVASEL